MKNVVQDLTSAGIDWQREKWQSGLGSKFIHQGEKNAAKYADEVIVLSKGVQDYFKETYGRKTHFIPNGVNRPQIREASLITDKFGLKKDSYRAVRKLRTEPTEEHLWEVVLLYSGVRFKTYSGLPFTYEIRKGRNGQYTKELWIDRRENSKSLAWSSVLLALNNIKEVGAVVDRPKALGDIRGVTYIYGMLYRFGLIDMPDKVNGKMKRAGRQM